MLIRSRLQGNHSSLLSSVEISVPLELQADQVLDQITLLAGIEPEIHTSVVVFHHGVQIREAPVVIEASLEVSRYRAQRRCPIAVIRAAIGLETVNADLTGLMKIPT